MKHALFLTAAAAAALSLAACNKPAATPTDPGAENKTAVGATVDKAQDATGAAVGAASANTVGSHDTAAFVSNASQSDIYEIEAAKTAVARTRNLQIKAFARMMVTDHTATSKALAPLAAAGKSVV